MGASRSTGDVTMGPWLFGARLDLAAFTGSALLAFALLAVRRSLGLPAALPEWGWVILVLGVDVAHVYGTLFRTYLDGAELRRFRGRYVGVPLVVYAVGVALHVAGGALFFRVLAYLAVLHFVRQQIGWAALYRARAGDGRLDKVIDDAAIYAATGYPLVVWHAFLDGRRYSWLVAGDFVDLSHVLWPWLGAAHALYVAAIAVFGVRQVWVMLALRRIALGKILLVTTTIATWYVGIVGSTGDFDFTATNVLTHGIPYMVLLAVYGNATVRAGRTSLAARIMASGVGVFLTVLLACALVEEAGWDRLVWHDHEWLFGAGERELRGIARTLLVPLLALPQATHYVLDGFLWRRREPALSVLDVAFSAAGRTRGSGVRFEAGAHDEMAAS